MPRTVHLDLPDADVALLLDVLTEARERNGHTIRGAPGGPTEARVAACADLVRRLEAARQGGEVAVDRTEARFRAALRFALAVCALGCVSMVVLAVFALSLAAILALAGYAPPAHEVESVAGTAWRHSALGLLAVVEREWLFGAKVPR